MTNQDDFSGQLAVSRHLSKFCQNIFSRLPIPIREDIMEAYFVWYITIPVELFDA
jgi:hypothetical protein